MLVFLYYSFRGTDVRALWSVLEKANYWWVVALLPCLVLSHWFRTWRWMYMMRPIKKELQFRNLFSALMIGYMMNNVLPKAGELARPYAIGKLEGVSRSAALGSVLVERIFDVLSFMVALAMIPLVYSGPLEKTFPWLEQAGIWFTVATLTGFAVLVVLMMRRDVVAAMLEKITRRLSEKNAKRVETIVHSFLDGFLFLRDTGSYVAIIALTIIIWLLYVVMMYLPFYAFNLQQTYSLGWGAAWVVQAISSIGILIPTPAATGPYHYFVIQTLTKLYGVNDELAQSYAAATHAIATIGITVIGLYYFLKDKMHLADVSGDTEKAAVAND